MTLSETLGHIQQANEDPLHVSLLYTFFFLQIAESKALVIPLFHPNTAGLGFGNGYESLFVSEMAKEQLHASAQQRKLERRASLVGDKQVCSLSLLIHHAL